MLFRVGDKYLNSAHVFAVEFNQSTKMEKLVKDETGQKLMLLADLIITPVLVMTNSKQIEFDEFAETIFVEEEFSFDRLINDGCLKVPQQENRITTAMFNAAICSVAKEQGFKQAVEKSGQVKASILDKVATAIGIGIISPSYGKPV